MRLSQYKTLLFILLLCQNGKSFANTVVTYSSGDTLGGNNPILPNYQVLFNGNYAGTQIDMQINSSISVSAGFKVQAAIGSPTSTILGDTTHGNDGTISIVNSAAITSPSGQTTAIDLSPFNSGIATGPSFTLQNNKAGVITGDVIMPQAVFNNTTCTVTNTGSIVGNLISNTANNLTNVTYNSTAGGSFTGIFTIPTSGTATYLLDNAKHIGTITSNNPSASSVSITLQNNATLSGNIIFTNNNAVLVYTLNNSTHNGSVTASSGALGSATFNFTTANGGVNSVTGGITGPQHAASSTTFNFNGGTTTIADDITTSSATVTSTIGSSLATAVNANSNYTAGALTIYPQSSLAVTKTLTVSTMSIANGATVTANNLSASGALSVTGGLNVIGSTAMTISSLSILGGYTVITVPSFTSSGITISQGNATITGTPTINGDLTVSGGSITLNGNTTVANNLNISGGNVAFNNDVHVSNGTTGVQQLNSNIKFGGNLTIDFNAASAITIGQQGVVQISGNFSAAAQNITNNGSLSFIGKNLTLTANNYIVNGVHKINFHGAANPGILAITGNANLSGGGVFLQIYNSGDLLNSSYAILSTTGALTGPAAGKISFSSNIRAMIPSVTTVGNQLMLSGTRNQAVSFSIQALNNLWKSFNTIEPQKASNPDLKLAIAEMVSMIDNNSKEQADNLLTQLLPQPSATKIHTLASKAVVNTLSMHVAQAREIQSYQASDTRMGSSFWIRPLVSYGNQLANQGYMGYESTTGGLLLGIDSSFNKYFTFGIACGYSGTLSTEKVNHKSKNKVYSLQFAPYTNINLGEDAKYGYLDLFYNYSLNNIHSVRMVSMNNYLSGYGSKYHTNQNTFKVAYSKSIIFNKEFTFIPTFHGLYSHSSRATYKENGNSMRLTTTVNAQHTYELGAGLSIIHRPQQLIEQNARIEFRILSLWNVGNKNLISNGQFTVGGNTFTNKIKSDNIGCQAGLGMTFNVATNVDLEFNYDFRIYKHYYEHTGFIQTKYLF